MNKRIKSLALVFVMVLSMLATAVPAMAAPVGSDDTEFSIGANKTSAAPGEEIEFTVYLQQTGNLTLIEAKVSIPTGLTYVSGKLVDGIKDTLGWDGMDWTPDPSMILNGYGTESYTGTDKLALMTFKCTVDSDAPAGNYEVTLKDYLSGNEIYEPKAVTTCVPVTITVTGASKPATGISLNKTELTLTEGKSETLTATVTPTDTTDTVVWESSKDTVATVDSNGKVTAKAPGEAVITAKAGTQTATCTVKVEAAACTHPNKTTVPEKASDCTNKGWDEYQKCNDCGALFNMSGSSIAEIPYRPLDPNAHTFGSWIDEVPANCTNTGTKGYKDCTLCGKHFDNTDAEISDLTIPTNDIHDFDTTTWGYKGADGHAHVCTRNPAHKDTIVAHTSSGPATEDTAETCTVCGYVIATATGHTHSTTLVPEVEADCTTDGVKEHYKCTEPTCGKLGRCRHCGDHQSCRPGDPRPGPRLCDHLEPRRDRPLACVQPVR